MLKSEKPQNRDINLDDGRTTVDSTNSITEQMGSSELTNSRLDKIDHSKRGFLRFGMVAALGMALGAASPSKARADEYNPTQDTLAPVLQERLGGRETAPEKMPIEEMLIMDDAMQVLFRTMHHFSFWSNLVLLGKTDEAKKTMETVMDSNNREKFWYKRGEKGVITIKKRKPDSPYAYIEIRNGVITKINDFKINHNKMTDFDTEWKGMDQKIKTISGKMRTNIDPDTRRPPLIADWEYGWYSLYSMVMPRTILKSLQLKGDLTTEEIRVKDALAELLINHPQNIEEKKEGLKEFEKTLDSNVLKSETIMVLRRDNTPAGAYEIARYSSGTGLGATVAYVSKDGFIMERKGDQLEKSDNREKLFFEMAASKAGLLTKHKDECDKELADYRSNLALTCSDEADELACLSKYDKTRRGCVFSKISKILLGKR